MIVNGKNIQNQTYENQDKPGVYGEKLKNKVNIFSILFGNSDFNPSLLVDDLTEQRKKQVLLLLDENLDTENSQDDFTKNSLNSINKEETSEDSIVDSNENETKKVA